MEVVIAIAVIMVILAPASALYIASTRTVAVNRNDLVAAALAEEGIEMVRNIRDTNFIKFSDNARECWNTLPDQTCPNAIADGSYRLSVNVDDLKWTFDMATAPLNSFVDPYGERKYDLAGPNDEGYRLMLDEDVSPLCESLGPPSIPNPCHEHFLDDTHLYFHAMAGGPTGTSTPFYREITIENVGLFDPLDGPDAMKIISRVLYRTGIAVRAIERVAFLTREPS